jgi:hypothetical protein
MSPRHARPTTGQGVRGATEPQFLVAGEVASVEAGEGVEQEKLAVGEMVVQEEGGAPFPDSNLGDISGDADSVDLPAAQLEKGAANHVARCSPWPVDQEDAVSIGLVMPVTT